MNVYPYSPPLFALFANGGGWELTRVGFKRKPLKIG
jgi:hypothetical protein